MIPGPLVILSTCYVLIGSSKTLVPVLSDSALDEDYDENGTYNDESIPARDKRRITADEYYEDAVRETSAILEENLDHINETKEVLYQTYGENGAETIKLCESLDSVKRILDQNVDTLRHKLGLELTLVDMSQPIQESTLKMLSSTWKEVQQSIDKLESHKRTSQVEQLKNWLDNVEHKIYAQFGVIESIMSKIRVLQRQLE